MHFRRIIFFSLYTYTFFFNLDIPTHGQRIRVIRSEMFPIIHTGELASFLYYVKHELLLTLKLKLRLNEIKIRLLVLIYLSIIKC